MKKRINNEYITDGDTSRLIIHSSKYGVIEFIVDTEDIRRIRNFQWGVNFTRGTYYARYTYPRTGNTKSALLLHRLITSFEWEIVDHINGNPLDNRKANLRSVTILQNNQNCRMRGRNALGVKGVCKVKNYDRYRVTFQANKKKMHVGYYTCLVEAAKAYNAAAKKHFGEFARLNDIDEIAARAA